MSKDTKQTPITNNNHRKNNYRLWIKRVIVIEALLIGIIIFAYAINGSIIPFGKIDNDTISGFGTFVGGFVGTIFSGAAVIIVLSTYFSQKEELKATRKVLETQNASIATQNFENTFFQLLAGYNRKKNTELFLNPVHRRSQDTNNHLPLIQEAANGIALLIGNITRQRAQNSIEVKGRNDYEIKVNTLKLSFKRFIEEHGHTFESYLHNVYNLIQFVDESNLEYESKIFYIKLIKADLTPFELPILFYWSFSTNSSYPFFSQYIVKYKLLENLQEYAFNGMDTYYELFLKRYPDQNVTPE